jgi:hypothetical protein
MQSQLGRSGTEASLGSPRARCAAIGMFAKGIDHALGDPREGECDRADLETGTLEARYVVAMKEDVLEQIVDDYLKFRGYFTVHNVSFRPDPAHPDYEAVKDRVPSDVDVIGFHPRLNGPERVHVVSCKSWQTGFDADYWLRLLRDNRKVGRRFAWQFFRELWIPKWATALRKTVANLTGATEFAYSIAVTDLRGDPLAWRADARIAANLPGCSVGFLPLSDIWAELLTELTTRPASSEIGRLAQLLKAAGLTASELVAEPSGPTPGSDADLIEQAETLGET